MGRQLGRGSIEQGKHARFLRFGEGIDRSSVPQFLERKYVRRLLILVERIECDAARSLHISLLGVGVGYLGPFG